VKRVESELELTRWSESKDSPLAQAIATLQEHRPDATELGALASRLAVRGITVTAPEVSPDPSGSAWTRWALLGGGVVSGLAVWLALREPAPSFGVQPAARRAPAALAAGPVASTRTALPPRRVGAAAIPTTTATTPSAATEPEPLREEPTRPLPEEASPSPARSRSSSQTAAREPDRPRLESSHSVPRGLAAPPLLAPDSASAVAAPTEIELLRDARLVLRQSPAAALQLVESHARAFPNGKLSQERELIAISALAALGRRTAALSRASRFEQSFPASPYRKQIDALLR
jgi:hypothetical protein